MIFDTSYSDKEITRKINQAVGLPFSWKERWKMGGIGSRRMTIHEISEDYKKYLNADHYVSTASIELRPKGIIIHFRHKLQAYSWIMPFSSLKIEYDNSLRLESEGKHIYFDDPKNDPFIKRMIKLSTT
ncbi:hypothetical protein AAOE16_04375 [Ekhidna sp. MALMAid0563]|uniref:hypothetical protein n=1 Tax=Ekhidna sp. MALMAid0563 TaxID=3143937 RepID=UPI0032DE3FEC